MASHIRSVTAADAAGMNVVYNPFILLSPATFETEPIDGPARRRWIEARLGDPRHPVLVAEDAGRIIGFANASPFDARAAYETSVKVSVFLAPEGQGRGTGAKLYEALFSEIGESGRSPRLRAHRRAQSCLGEAS